MARDYVVMPEEVMEREMNEKAESNLFEKIYNAQKETVDDLWNVFDEMMELVHKKENESAHLLYSEMRKIYTLWRELTQAQQAIDTIIDCALEDANND